MANCTGNKNFCDVCLHKDITKPAVEFCSQCTEALCIDCTDHHKFSKATKSHKSITVDEYMKLPEVIRNLDQHCAEHDDILEFYCGSHEELCCKRCITSMHSACGDTKVIQDLINGSNSSSALDGLERTLQDIERNIKTAIDDRRQNLKELKSQCQIATDEINKMRCKINSYLDKLEQELLRNLSSAENEQNNAILVLIQELDAKQKQISEFRSHMELMKIHASSVQIFLGTRELLKKVIKEEEAMKAMYNNGVFNQTKIACQIDAKIEGLTSEVKTFGDVAVKKEPARISINRQTDMAAQIYTAHKRTFGSLHAVLKRTVDVKNVMKNITITGCAISRDCNTLLFADNSGGVYEHVKTRVLKFQSGQFIQEKLMQSNCVFDIKYITDKNVTITTGDLGRKIVVIDADNLITQIQYDTQDWCYGVTCHNGSLIFCSYTIGFKVLSMEDGKISAFPFVRSESVNTYITSSEKYIYHSKFNTHQVTCYDFSGKTIWTFCDQTILKEPRGITVDFSSNVYVAGTKTNNVVVISPDGKDAKQLLGHDDGIDEPHAIDFNIAGNILLVTNSKGLAFLYEIQ